MSFELLPNEVLEYLFSFLSLSHFPLRQTCKLFREVIPPLDCYDFKDQAYEAGDVALIEHYNLPCSQHNLETILRKGHEELFKREEDRIKTGYSFASACVQGRSIYIIDYLFKKGYVTRTSLVDEACRQNYLDLVKDLYREEINIRDCALLAVSGEALDVLSWIVEKDNNYYNAISYEAVNLFRTKVLRWLPQEQIKKIGSRYMFICACSAPNLDMYNFLAEIDHLPRQGLLVNQNLCKSFNVAMMRDLVKSKGWTLNEDMFVTALELGYEEMLSCLLELDCPLPNLNILYDRVRSRNITWLLKNLPPTEEIMLEICMSAERERLLFQLIKGYLPESFKNNPEITLAALEAGLIDVAEEYLAEDYVFYEDVCLRVENPTSLEWLIENEINLYSELYYRLVRETNTPLLEKLHDFLDVPEDLLDYTFALIQECASHGDYKNKTLKRLKKISRWIRDL
nr:hypothetical protein Clen_529 [Cedratvirus lena]